MQKKTADMIAAAADDLGIELTIHDDYGGRCMYGETTHGVVFSSLGDLLACCISAMEATSDSETKAVLFAFLCDLKKIRTDDMGRNTIAY